MAADPRFSREAGAVLASPYFFDDDADRAEFRRRSAERDVLSDALDEAGSYDALPAAARGIYDVARRAIEAYANDADFRRRTQEESVFGEEEETSSRELTPEESSLLFAGIIGATLKGDHEGAARIAALAKTPEKIVEILGS